MHEAATSNVFRYIMFSTIGAIAAHESFLILGEHEEFPE